MFRRMTFEGASSFLGGVVSILVQSVHASTTELTSQQGALLTIVPWVLVFYGPRIRARSKFASVTTPHIPNNAFTKQSMLICGNQEIMG